jgi:hypothetical protein
MFGFGKEGAFIKDVETSMVFLLGFQGDDFVKAIFKGYPNTKSLVIDKMKERWPINKIASEVLRAVLADQITRALSPEQRKQLETFLGSSEPIDAAPFPFAKLCRGYITMMFRESDLKKLDGDWVKDCVRYVYYAAQGMSEKQILAKILGDAFLSPGSKPTTP